MLRRLYDWTLSLAGRKSAEVRLAVIAFIESSFFLIPADVLFLPMAIARLSTMRREREEVAVYGAADIGDDALADPGDVIEAHGGGDRHQRRDAEQREEVIVDEAGAFGREAVVDHRAHGERQNQRRDGGADKRDQREDDAGAIRPQERPEGAQTRQIARARARRRRTLKFLFSR